MNDFAHWSIGCKPSLPRSCSCWQLLADPNLVRTFAWGTFVCTTFGADICHQMPGPYLNADIYLPGPYLGAEICLEDNCLDPISKQTFA